MAGFLIDTNALSILAPKQQGAAHEGPAGAFRTWVRAHEEALFLSVITIAEIEAGIARLDRRGASRRAGDLARWRDLMINLYASRILAFDAFAAREAGRLLDRAAGLGAAPGFEDAAIAATAAVHDLTVVTANVRHFEPFGVAFMTPPS